MLTVKCNCGETYHADEAHIGRSLRCIRCDQLISITGAAQPQITDAPSEHHFPKFAAWQVSVVVASVSIVAVVAMGWYLLTRDASGPSRGPSPPSLPPPIVSEPVVSCKPSESPAPSNATV